MRERKRFLTCYRGCFLSLLLRDTPFSLCLRLCFVSLRCCTFLFCSLSLYVVLSFFLSHVFILTHSPSSFFLASIFSAETADKREDANLRTLLQERSFRVLVPDIGERVRRGCFLGPRGELLMVLRG